MTTEEAIKFARYAQSMTAITEVREFYGIAESALHAQQERENSEPKGLFGKYIVRKASDGTPVDNCFVLRPEKDPAAIVAIRAYAEAAGNSILAADLIQWIGEEKPLTLEELHQMGGGSVWCVDGSGNEMWGLVDADYDHPDVIDSQTGLWRGEFYNMTGDGEKGLHCRGWLAYRHKPKEVNNEEI